MWGGTGPQAGEKPAAVAQTTASGGGATPLFLGRGEGKKKTVDGLVCNYRKVKRAFCKLKFPIDPGLK